MVESPELVKKVKYSYKQFSMTRLIGNIRFSKQDSNRIYYLDNTSKRFDLWRQDSHGSYAHQLTSSEDWSIMGFGVSKDDSFILLTGQYQGNELSQIFKLSALGGIPERITPDKTKRYFPSQNGLLEDGKTLVLTTDALGTTMDVALFNIETQEFDQLTATDTNYFAASVSPDFTQVIISESISNTNNNLYLMNLETRELTLLTEHEGEIQHNFQEWGHDSKGFYFTTNSNREFRAAAYYSLETKSYKFLIERDWDVNQLTVSKNGKWMAYAVNEDGYDVIHIKNLETDQAVDPAKFPKGIIGIHEFSDDEKYLAYTYSNAKKVSDVHILNLEEMTEQVITDNMIGGIDTEDMVEPELVRFNNGEFDIPAFLYKPKNIKEGEKIPIVLSVHGGPEAQERPGYAYVGLYQMLTYLGIGVLAPNIRGSAGYGMAYQKLIHRNWIGIKTDLKACAEYMKELPWVDEKQLGIWGGSFGGYATLFGVSFLPEYWKLGVSLVGPSNLITFVKSVPEFWKPMMKAWVGDPIEDEDMLNAASPINFVENIRAEMFIGQGANDPRVVKAESDQIVEKLKEMGNHVVYKVWENEGHGFTKMENFHEFLRLLVEFVYERFFGNKLDLDVEDF